MDPREALSTAGRAIWSHKLRSFLTLLGVIFGIATVIFVVTLIEGFNTYVEEKVSDMGSNAFVVARIAMATSLKEFKEKEQRNRTLTRSEVDAILANRNAVADVASIARTRTQVKAGDKLLNDIRVAGVSTNLLKIDTVRVGQGRFIERHEDLARANVAFVGIDIARDLFPTLDPVGQEIKVDGRPYRIIGVAEEIGTVFGQPQDRFVYVPISTYFKTYGSHAPMILKVSAVTPDRIDEAAEEVRFTLRARRHLAAGQADTFDIVTPDAINQLRDSLFGTISIVAVGVTSISLLVGGIVIMNIMLVSVTERTREIGIRKSLGARRRDIVRQFLAESTLLALAGGCIGILLAWLLAKGATAALSVPTALPLGWTIAALSVSAGVGMVFGIYPAWRAAGLDPIIALRAD
jgi:putative ABC transport system permease protein